MEQVSQIEMEKHLFLKRRNKAGHVVCFQSVEILLIAMASAIMLLCFCIMGLKTKILVLANHNLTRRHQMLHMLCLSRQCFSN